MTFFVQDSTDSQRTFEFDWRGVTYRLLPMSDLPPMAVAEMRAQGDELTVSMLMLKEASSIDPGAWDAIKTMPAESFNSFLEAYRDFSLITEGESSASGI